MTSALVPRRGGPSGSDSSKPPLRELRSVVERITYQNPDNGYTVARLAPERTAEGPMAAAVADDDRLVTLVGTLADLTLAKRSSRTAGGAMTPSMAGVPGPGVPHGLAGDAPGHEEVSRQRAGQSVGPIMGGRIVETFGEATFEVIDATPERMTQVPGIGPVRARRIAETWEEQRHIREVMAALQG